MEELVRYIAEAIVEDKSKIVISTVEVEPGKNTIKLQVPQEELGKVIGRQGRTAKSIRTILAAASIKDGIDNRLEISEAE